MTENFNTEFNTFIKNHPNYFGTSSLCEYLLTPITASCEECPGDFICEERSKNGDTDIDKFAEEFKITNPEYFL